MCKIIRTRPKLKGNLHHDNHGDYVETPSHTAFLASRLYTLMLSERQSTFSRIKKAVTLIRLPLCIYGSNRLLFYNICSLRTAIAFHNVKCYILTLFKCFESFFLDSGIMNENIISFFHLNEAIAFFRIKPFYYAIFHCK